MNDLPHYHTFRKIEPIHKGWSKDKKYYIETNSQEKLLLRLSDITTFQRKEQEYEAITQISKLNINMTQPVDFGICENGSKVYTLLTWVDGQDAEEILPLLSEAKQYELGIEAGNILRKIHSIPAPKELVPWGERFNKKIDRNIDNYRNCGIKMQSEEHILNFVDTNRFLLNGREQTMQHGDYHVGNLTINSNHQLGVIDFNRFDYGDPWDEFNRIVFSVEVSEAFSNGIIHGYFEDDIPEEFFKLMALYIASNAISSLPWAIPFGQKDIDVMHKNIGNMLSYYDHFNVFIPSWYKERNYYNHC